MKANSKKQQTCRKLCYDYPRTDPWISVFQLVIECHALDINFDARDC